MNEKFKLLKELPFQSKGTVKTKRFWCNVIGTDSEGFEKLKKQNWFK